MRPETGSRSAPRNRANSATEEDQTSALLSSSVVVMKGVQIQCCQLHSLNGPATYHASIAEAAFNLDCRPCRVDCLAPASDSGRSMPSLSAKKVALDEALLLADPSGSIFSKMDAALG